MRKSSSEILKEILLEKELESLSEPDRDALMQAIEDMQNFKINEFEALEVLKKYKKKSTPIGEFIDLKIIDHAKKIIAMLGGITFDQFEQRIKEVENEEVKYRKIRNTIRK